jgi:RNA polymerase sigma-70 factor (ECF subfamily)
MTDEARLIARAARGDRDAFEELVRSRQERVFWTAFQVVGDEDDARDVAQQVFIRLWQVLPRYRPRRRFDSWLYRITVNLAIDAYRRRQARPESPGAGEPVLPVPAGEPGESLRQDEIQRIFLRLARRLSGQQRAVFVLREMNDLDNREIARVMELSESTVRNHLHQARKILRRGLAALYPEYLPAREVGREPGEEGR